MENPVILKMSLANTSNYDFRPEELYEFLERDKSSVHGYKFEPKGFAAAAIDYILILGIVGSTASIASLLWTAYEKFIGSKKRDKADSAGLFISLDVEAGSDSMFWIGKDYADKELFIRIFSKKLAEFKETNRASEVYKETLEEIGNSENWIQRK